MYPALRASVSIRNGESGVEDDVEAYAKRSPRIAGPNPILRLMIARGDENSHEHNRE